jgi:hypothetical protein
VTRPSVFIAGNSKSGTSALYQFLKVHPDVFMSSPKEPNYFARDFLRDPDPAGSFHPHSLDWYLGLFEHARPDQICGEASAVYLYSSVAAREIHAFNPDARLVFILREPVSFLHSYHLQQLKNPVTEGEDEKDFEKALALEPFRRQGQRLPKGCLVPELNYYSERIRYAAHLQRYLEVFDRSQLLILLYDDFRRDNAGTYRQVLAFLGLNPNFTPDFRTVNEGSKLRSKSMQQLMRRLTFGQGWAAPVKALAKRLLPAPMRKKLVQQAYDTLVFEPKDEVDPILAARLKAQFRPEVEHISTLLGRDLVTLWGY